MDLFGLYGPAAVAGVDEGLGQGADVFVGGGQDGLQRSSIFSGCLGEAAG